MIIAAASLVKKAMGEWFVQLFSQIFSPPLVIRAWPVTRQLKKNQFISFPRPELSDKGKFELYYDKNKLDE